MHILPPVRPEKSIERLTAILEPIAEKVHVVPRKRLTWLRKGKQQMYLFLEGELSLLRASDGLVVVTVYEPHLFGIAEMIQPTQGHLLRAERESTILRLDADKAAELFRAEGVWEDVAALLSYHTAYLIFRDAQVLQQRTYSVIRNHLQEMILLPEETRLRTTILEYIRIVRCSLAAVYSMYYLPLSRGNISPLSAVDICLRSDIYPSHSSGSLKLNRNAINATVNFLYRLLSQI